jgi:uncharacterized protein
MGKILFWVVVIVGVLLVTRLLTHYAANRKATPPPPANAPPRSLNASEEMVRCSHCQVYTPRSESIKQDDEFWCSPDHAKKGMRHPL